MKAKAQLQKTDKTTVSAHSKSRQMENITNRYAFYSIFRPRATEIGLYLCVFSAVYLFVLQYVFPGYIDPLWPHHSDLYIPQSLANSYSNPIDLLTFPRPIGFAFLWAIGHLGARGAIGSLIALQAVNFCLIALIFRRASKACFNAGTMLSVALFAYLVTSHPFQYQFSTMDATSSISLLLLLLASMSMIFANNWYVAFCLTLLAFLAKETFALSAAFLCFYVALQPNTRKSGVMALIMMICALAIALTLEHFLSSPFTSDRGEYGVAYAVDLSPFSVLREFTSYVAAGLNPLTYLIIVASVAMPAVAFGLKSRECMMSVAAIAAGALAIVPNSLLPHHHFDGYSFNAAFLIFCPVVGIAKCIEHCSKLRYANFLMVAMTLASPVLSSAAFTKQQWIVTDERRQRLLSENIAALLPAASGKTVLVSGLNVPNAIFWHRAAIRSMPNARGTQFLVVRYDSAVDSKLAKRIDRSGTNVKFVTPDQVDNLSYSEAWLFRSDGSLEKRLAQPSDLAKWRQDNLTELDLVKYPELKDAFPASTKYDGNNYIACGSKLIDYRQYALAEVCLLKAAVLAPTNPYSHFFLGISLEHQGKIDQARTEYRRAVEVEAESPNPAFREALERIR
jgi:hypothetical protein